MNSTNDPTSLTDYLATLDPIRTGLLIAAVLAAQIVLHLILARTTRRARARAHEAARAWADEQRTLWRARAAARAERIAEAATAPARAERAARRGARWRVAGVAIVAIGATNLSAHAIQAGLDDVDLGALDTRISVFIVFEAVLALAAGLSWWHQTTNRPGIDRYRLIVWGMAGLMGYLAWQWGGALIHGLWPLIAAGAWHEVVAAEARRRHGGLGLIARIRAAAADRIRRRFLPAGEADRARRIITIERRAWRANTTRLTRVLWERAYVRALDAADVRGYLDDATRRTIAERMAARYSGARALAPDAVAHLNPWTRLADTPAPADDDSDARAPERATLDTSIARTPLRVVVEAAPEPRDADMDARAIVEQLLPDTKGVERATVVDWVATYYTEHGSWPTGRAVADAFSVHPATGRRWLAAVKDAA